MWWEDIIEIIHLFYRGDKSILWLEAVCHSRLREVVWILPVWTKPSPATCSLNPRTPESCPTYRTQSRLASHSISTARYPWPEGRFWAGLRTWTRSEVGLRPSRYPFYQSVLLTVLVWRDQNLVQSELHIFEDWIPETTLTLTCMQARLTQSCLLNCILHDDVLSTHLMRGDRSVEVITHIYHHTH